MPGRLHLRRPGLEAVGRRLVGIPRRSRRPLPVGQNAFLMAEPISRADVAHVSVLARLQLTDEELDQFTEQLGAVLEHAADIAALDIAGVPPTAHPLPLENVLRDDE